MTAHNPKSQKGENSTDDPKGRPTTVPSGEFHAPTAFGGGVFLLEQGRKEEIGPSWLHLGDF